MIAGFETRAHVLAQLAALEREKSSGHMNARWLEAIESQERLFRAELESLGGGDYPQPDPHPAAGTLAHVGRDGRGLIIA